MGFFEAIDRWVLKGIPGITPPKQETTPMTAEERQRIDEAMQRRDARVAEGARRFKEQMSEEARRDLKPVPEPTEINELKRAREERDMERVKQLIEALATKRMEARKRIEGIKDQERGITAFGDLVVEDRRILEKLQAERDQLSGVLRLNEPIFTANDLVRVDRTPRDERGRPTGPSSVQGDWFVVVPAVNGEQYLVGKAVEGEEPQVREWFSAADLEEWNSKGYTPPQEPGPENA